MLPPKSREATIEEKDNLIMMVGGDPMACLAIATGAVEKGDYPVAMLLCEKAMELMSETINNLEEGITHD